MGFLSFWRYFYSLDPNSQDSDPRVSAYIHVYGFYYMGFLGFLNVNPLVMTESRFRTHLVMTLAILTHFRQKWVNGVFGSREIVILSV